MSKTETQFFYVTASELDILIDINMNESFQERLLEILLENC